MRKYIILFIAICLHIATRGQTIADIDLSGLPQPTTAKALRYWIDDDIGSLQTTDILNGQHTVDVSSLQDGLHTIHYQIIDSEDKVAAPYSGIFLKMDNLAVSGNVTAEKLIYWFDDEITTKTIDMASGIMTLDASALTDGLHTVHYLVKCSDGSVTSAYSSIFLRMNIDILSTTAQSLRYWFDDDTEVTTTEIAQGIQTIDASHLLDGLHTVHYQIVDDSGSVTSPVSNIFLKMAEGIKTTTAQSLRYWFDNETDVRTTSVAGGTQSIDVSDLQAGLHTLHYQLVDSEWQLTSPVSCIFLKMFDKPYEEGQNAITKYQYWQNNSATVRTVTLDVAANPYTLIALLPMQKELLRSECFHFEMKDGKPMMYAKNDLHVRFTDRAGYFIDDSRQFIDYSVSQDVNPIGELQGTQTFQKVAANDVRWYTMQAAPGDTVAFKLSQPATIQLFTPSGAEVFKTSQSESVNWGGIHTWENGTYYLSVHDVTGSQSTIKLEYMHMDKYDVVDWDVHTVGNGGCSTITFKGNGFRNLYAVDLVIAPGDTIRSVDVSHDSDAETAVTFDFTGAELGEYNAVFHFTEEDKPIANVVTVEEAIDIELATDVSFPSSFLRGTSTTYTIKITNKGNMTAYAVPLSTYISSNTIEGISHISIKGANLPSLFDKMDLDSLSATDKQSLKDFSDKIGDEHYFTIYKTASSSLDSIIIRSGIFFVNINPYETKHISFVLTATENVDAWFSTPNNWSSLVEHVSSNQTILARRTLKESYCCIHERIECYANATSTGMDMLSLALLALAVPTEGAGAVAAGVTKFVGCVSSAVSSASSFVSGLVCDTDKSLKEKLFSMDGALGAFSTLGAIATCGGLLKKFVKYKEMLQKASDILRYPNAFGTGWSCAAATIGKKPNCPPNPSGGGGSSTPQPPSDPNDIYGYLSEAGSKFIADSVARVNYTIEFENDTTFATAAAHTIVIKDTLDSRYFDLKAFMPTGVRIGSREAFLNEADVVTNNDKTTFVKTIDMRPEINAIAQVEGEFNQKNGIAQWTFQSLDPMTMEPTDGLMQGILPVNYDGTSGIGEVMFDIGVKQGKADGTEISNRASIVFDYEEAIQTPTWTNIVDSVAPTSIVNGLSMLNDSTLHITADGLDERSGIWKYEWYVQAGKNAPWWKECETDSASFDYHIYEGINYGFCVLAVDSAGNVEQKVIKRERGFISIANSGDANCNGEIEIGDVTSVLTLMATPEATGYDRKAADANANGEIEIGDVTTILTKMANGE